MAILVIETQYLENYGTEDKPHWKAKGGTSYKVTNVQLNVDFNAVVEASGVAYSNSFAEEYVITWHVESDDWMSSFERSQLEFDGAITHPEPIIDYGDLYEQV